VPDSLISALADETILCRCESIRIGQAKAAIREFDLAEINRMKAITRVGMGRCQGRMFLGWLAMSS